MIILKNEATLLEGYLQKYKPGLNLNYRAKYVVLTKTDIKIFKSKWQVQVPYVRSSSMTEIPLSTIKECQRVKVMVGK